MSVNRIIQPCLHDSDQYAAAPGAAGRYFRFLDGEPASWIAEGLNAAFKDLGHIRVLEIKGETEHQQDFQLFHEKDAIWIVYQFLGRTVINNGTIHHLKSTEYAGFGNGEHATILQIDRGKTWLACVCVHGNGFLTLQEEYKDITEFLVGPAGTYPVKPLLIGYQQKKVLEKIQQLQGGEFSLLTKIHYHIHQLIGLFGQDLNVLQYAPQHTEVALYYRALEYIQEHALDYKILRKEIAEHLCVTERTLTRAFEQKRVTIGQTIQMVRLGQAREWVRHSDRSVEDIVSSLHFLDRSDFTAAYRTLFKVTPEEDRKKQGLLRVALGTRP